MYVSIGYGHLLNKKVIRQRGRKEELNYNGQPEIEVWT